MVQSVHQVEAVKRHDPVKADALDKHHLFFLGITLRVTPRVKETIRERAKAAGLTVTDYLCYSGLGKEIVRVEGLEQVLSELKAQGRNLNQLTTLANMGRVSVVKGDTLAENYGKIYEQLRELLREVT